MLILDVLLPDMCFMIILRTLSCLFFGEFIIVSRMPWVSSGMALVRKGAGEKCCVCVLSMMLIVAGAVIPLEDKLKSGDSVDLKL